MRVSALYRHPVKSLGAEPLASVALEAGRTMPGDRIWAVAHERSRYDFEAVEWARCTTFLRGATFPELMAVTAEWNRGGAPEGPVTFRHPRRDDLTADPGTAEGEAALLAWMDPLIPDGAPRPARLARAVEDGAPRGMTDSSRPTVSLMSDASRAALAERAGAPLDRRRFRGNVWLESGEPWAEFDLIGRRVRLGGAELEVTGRIDRCSATHANPETGARDVDLLETLKSGWRHTDFGVKAEVVEGGPVALGDRLEG
jgi:uncharacterized protein